MKNKILLLVIFTASRHTVDYAQMWGGKEVQFKVIESILSIQLWREHAGGTHEIRPRNLKISAERSQHIHCLLSFSCCTGNFGKIWFAWGQQWFQHTERKTNMYTYNYITIHSKIANKIRLIPTQNYRYNAKNTI